MQITLTREDEWRKMHQVEYRHSYSRVYLLTAGAFKQAKSPSTSPQTERLSAASLQIVPSGSQATLRWLKLQFSKSRHSLGCGNGGGGAREQRKQALAPPTKKRSRASRIFGGNKQESCITINVLLFQSQRQKKRMNLMPLTLRRLRISLCSCCLRKWRKRRRGSSYPYCSKPGKSTQRSRCLNTRQHYSKSVHVTYTIVDQPKASVSL